MNITNLLCKCHNTIEGTFNDLDKFNFCGVYILSDENDTVVYIGSAYARTIKKRLQQYLRPNDSGNTLGKTIAKQLAGTRKYGEEAKEKVNSAIEIIRSLKIHAIEHKDLEYHLVSTAKPQYNNSGKDED